jgi:hypothetical protein
VKEIVKKLLCEDNGDQLCIAKIMAVIAFISFLGYAAFGLIKGNFALDGFANGVMQVLLGAGGVIAGKNISTKGG